MKCRGEIDKYQYIGSVAEPGRNQADVGMGGILVVKDSFEMPWYLLQHYEEIYV